MFNWSRFREVLDVFNVNEKRRDTKILSTRIWNICGSYSQKNAGLQATGRKRTRVPLERRKYQFIEKWARKTTGLLFGAPDAHSVVHVHAFGPRKFQTRIFYS
jgi:hypothetical protein